MTSPSKRDKSFRLHPIDSVVPGITAGESACSSSTPTAIRTESQPIPFHRVPRLILQRFRNRIMWQVFSVPPALAFFDQCMVNLEADFVRQA